MAEIVLSAFLTVVFEKLASEALKKTVRSKGIESELKKLKKTLDQIQDLLNDASQKEVTNEAVKRWLNDLQHLAYDIDDLLDDLATEAIHRELTEEGGASTSMFHTYSQAIKDESLVDVMNFEMKASTKEEIYMVLLLVYKVNYLLSNNHPWKLNEELLLMIEAVKLQ